MSKTLLALLGRRLMADWPWKALALLVATALYLLLRGRVSHIQTLSVPVEVVRDPGLSILAVEPLFVQIAMRGTTPFPHDFASSDIRAVVRVNATNRQGVAHIRISERNIQGRGVRRMFDLSPRIVRVTYERPVLVHLPEATAVDASEPHPPQVRSLPAEVEQEEKR
jgi:hypothetical protein